MEIFAIFPGAHYLIAGFVGLIVGSFLNVVVYRVPIMLGRAWRQQCAELQDDDLPEPDHAAGKTFNLLTPGSTCPGCGTAIAPHHNVPVLSFLFLRGRCATCGIRISPRYPVVEAIAGILSLVAAWVFGPTWQLLLALPVTWTLLALSIIDIDHTLLPDSITLPLMWAGLLTSLFVVDGRVLFTDVTSSVIGAAAGYLALWSVYQVFKLATGKEGMGYGDFKLLAALGAWLGWQLLPLVIMVSAAVGTVFGTAMILFGGNSRETPIPFGPYLAAAGWIALLWGRDLTDWYARFLS
ncbi:MAG TPA: A24 family peptidase [Gammaproteobacteria bacterium]